MGQFNHLVESTCDLALIRLFKLRFFNYNTNPIKNLFLFILVGNLLLFLPKHHPDLKAQDQGNNHLKPKYKRPI